MPAGSLSFPLLSPVALAAVLTSSTPLALGKAQASLALLSLLRCCSSQTGDDEAGTLGVRRVESDLVAHQVG